MKRYTFLLIAFFLTYKVVAMEPKILETSAVLANINSNPDKNIIPDSSAHSNVKTIKTKKPSAGNTSQIGTILEPTDSSETVIKTKTVKTSSNNHNCKTYEGIIFEEGEAGYSDCIQKIKNDRQSIKTVP